MLKWPFPRTNNQKATLFILYNIGKKQKANSVDRQTDKKKAV
jgi:hypothetical protein